MADSTGICLAATGIGVGNEWMQTGTPNFRMGVAGLAVTVIFGGIERLNHTAGVGLSVMFLIGVLVTPIRGKAPLQSLGDIGNSQPSKTGVQK